MALDNIVPHSSLIATQLSQRHKEVVMPIMQKHKILGVLQQKGRITKNAHSYDFKWPVEYVVREGTWRLPGETIDSPQVNRHREASLGYRHFVVSESFDKFTLLANRGPEAMANLWDRAVESNAKACMRTLSSGLYVDGNLAGNTKKIHGLASCWKSDGAVHSASSKGSYGPNDLYAGLYTNPAYYGGEATDFPLNTVSPQAAFWSPLLLAYDYAWSGSTHTFAEHWRECMTFAMIYMEQLQSVQPDLWITTSENLRTIKDSLSEDEQINITRSPNEGYMAKLGYKAITYEGVEIINEKDCPADTTIGLCFDHLELKSMQNDLFVMDTDVDKMNLTKSMIYTFFGNLMIDSPAYLCRIGDLSALDA